MVLSLVIVLNLHMPISGDYLEDVWTRILMADSFLKNGFNPDNINSYYFKITQAEEESGEARFTKIEIIKNE